MESDSRSAEGGGEVKLSRLMLGFVIGEVTIMLMVAIKWWVIFPIFLGVIALNFYLENNTVEDSK